MEHCFSEPFVYFSIEGTITLVKEITITVKYSDEDIATAGGDPTLLILSYYDKDAGEWVILPTTVDTIAKTLTITVDNLGMWMVMAEEDPVEQAETITFWIWLVTVFGGLGVLFTIFSAITIVRRRKAKVNNHLTI